MTARPDGLPADSSGGPTVDPTKNVLDLVFAANQRQDDLRKAQDVLTTEKVRRVEQVALLEAEHAEKIASLRELHQRQLDTAESARIDSIRQVDVLATASTAAQALTAIQTLAQSQAASAETLRTAVATTATTIASQLASTVSELSKRLATLEQASYVGSGKQMYADPQLASLMSEVQALREARSSSTGRSGGMNSSWAIVIAVVTLLIMVAAILYRAPAPAISPVPAQPTIIYVPTTAPPAVNGKP